MCRKTNAEIGESYNQVISALVLHSFEQYFMFLFLATNGFPQCLQNLIGHFTSTSIRENIICTTNSSELKSHEIFGPPTR